jgi:unsaturated rhamnogalacturonyl hydrolase
MAEPFLVRYGALFADQVKPGDAQLCFRAATGQIEVAAEHTLDPKTKLYYHAWNDALDGSWRGLVPPTRVPPPAGAKTSPVLWSRAIGWYIAGIVDVLEYLPATDPERPALRAILRNLADGLERFQDRKTGLWYQVIDVKAGPLPATGGYAGERDRPAQPNWLETSASAIFAYSLAKAVRLGELPARYRAVATRAWNGVKTRIDVDGSGTAHIRGTVVGLSVGGTYNAYVNADVRGPSQLATGEPPAAASCPTAAQIPPGTTPPIACKYIYVRDDVPQGFGAVLLASTELEFTTAPQARHSTAPPAPPQTPVARSK